jgi:hypothetical protein
LYTNFLGTYRAIVTSNVDPTNRGFIKVQCPQVAGLAELNAAEPANKDAPIPNVGDLVWIYFNGGETHKPVYSVTTDPNIWHTPTLQPNWNFSTTVVGFGNGVGLRYKKMPDNTVWLYGGVTPSAGASNIVCILPPGFFNNAVNYLRDIYNDNTGDIAMAVERTTGNVYVQNVQVGAKYIFDHRMSLDIL